jgi:6-phosphogluconate dehydrogenase
MEIAIVGLGRMGMNMARRLLRDGHTVHAHNHTPDKIKEAQAEGAVPVPALGDLRKLRAPRAVWVMVPAGKATDDVIEQLSGILEKGDTIIDGGNSYYRDSVARHARLKQKGIHFLDAGTSGGIWGLQVGYCLMVGGEREAFARLEPVFRSLAPQDGYQFVGGPGAGHFAKMVHNGIEYGMMQAYAEGFEILRASEFGYDLGKLSHLWNQGSVVRSWLLELAELAFQKDADLSAIRGYVEDSGEGRWTVQEAMARNVPAPVITLSLLNRFRSRQPESFQAKVLAALRAEFGGHAVKTAGGKGGS